MGSDSPLNTSAMNPRTGRARLLASVPPAGRGAPVPIDRRVLLLLAVLLASCQPGSESEIELPAIPNLALQGVSPEVRAVLESARDEAVADPTSADANGAFGMLLHAYEMYPEASACYGRASVLDDRDGRWPYLAGVVQATMGRHDEAVRLYRSALKLGQPPYPAMIRLGESLLAGDQAAEAETAFESAVTEMPGSAAAHFGLGRALEANGHPERALRSFLRASEFAPDSGPVRYALAMAYRRMNRFADAERHLALAQSGSADPPSVSDLLLDRVYGMRQDKRWHLQQGLDLDAAGRHEDAIAAYQRAVSLDPNYLQAHVNLVAAFGRQRRYADAERHYRQALSLDAEAVELHINWGTVQATRGAHADAIRSFRQGLAINPNSADMHADLGSVFQKTGDTAQATTHLRRALELEPQHRLAHFNLARILIASDRVPEAIEHLLQIRDPVDDRTPGFLYGLADAYVRIGEIDQAVASAREARDLARSMGQAELAESIAEDWRALEARR